MRITRYSVIVEKAIIFTNHFVKKCAMFFFFMVRTSNISDAVASPVFLGQESKPELVKKVHLISPNELLLSPQASTIVRDEPPSEVSDIGGIFYTIYTSYPEHVGNFLEILHMSDGRSAK